MISKKISRNTPIFITGIKVEQITCLTLSSSYYVCGGKRMTRYERCVIAIKRLGAEVKAKKEEVNWVYPHPEVIHLEKKWLAARFALSRAEADLWR